MSGSCKKAHTILDCINRNTNSHLETQAMCHFQKRRLKEAIMTVFNYLKGCYVEHGVELFSILPELNIINNGLKL